MPQNELRPIERAAAILDLEVFLFGGVPERPEPVYGRDANDHVQCRTTRSQCAPPILPSLAGSEAQQTYLINRKTLEITVVNRNGGEENDAWSRVNQ